ncbi:MAG: hypothetical protein M3019_11740 [Candidatus Dormibacteraeota bacterium]|nr:hypothetical protein [Candidatus Dormibacteraeota bacterium]
MPKAARHPILYDVERWRKYRTWLLLPATVFALTSVFLTVLKPTSGGAVGYAVVAASLVAVATSLWTRQRFTYLVREDDRLVVRSMAASRRLGGEDIDRARLIRLSAVFNRPERRRLLPRPTDRWLATEAISLRLRDGVDLRALRRVVGPRCVVDDLLVVPVADAGGLLAEVVKHVSPPPPVAPSGGRRRRARRR